MKALTDISPAAGILIMNSLSMDNIEKVGIPPAASSKDTASSFTDVVPFPTLEPRPFDAKELPRQKKMEEQAQLASLTVSATSSNLSSLSPSAPVPAIAAAVAAAAAAQSNPTKTNTKKNNTTHHHSTPFHHILSSIAAITSTASSHCHSHCSESTGRQHSNFLPSINKHHQQPDSLPHLTTSTDSHTNNTSMYGSNSFHTISSSSSFSSTSTITSSSTTKDHAIDSPPSSISRSSSIRSFMGTYEKPFNQDRDAGNRPLDHYKTRLPPFRNRWRNAILPIVRWETPILAAIQKKLRNPFLDIYFALSANLGTHTCYVLMLPVAFWYGHSQFGRGLVFVLAFGVYITNFIKDLLCLPRPLSPPLHRLTMSGSAALEYGFPSTHTANAVSVSLLIAQALFDSKDSFSSVTNYNIAHALNALYVLTIVLGRIYCGMHGFLDVIGGLVIGAGLWWTRFVYGDVMDAIILSPSYKALWIIPFVLFLVRIHPEPADDCPCFDDGVAFLGVVAGCVVGEWHFTSTVYTTSPAYYNSIPFDPSKVGILGVLLRFLIGSILISIWRPVIKRTLHDVLPPLFRFLEKGGVSMPRRFFMPASQYEDVPPSLPDTTLFEPKNITSLFTKVGRSRGDSVGPQSTADVYESIAYREYQKQKAVAAMNHRKPSHATEEKSVGGGGLSSSSFILSSHLLPCHGVEDSYYDENSLYNSRIQDTSNFSSGSREVQEDELMSQIVIPRVRYDVEVVAKLIVYSGIGLIAVDLCGIIFVTLGI